MLKVSELLSKQLIVLNSAEIIGTIGNIIFDKKLTSGKLLKIFTEDENDVPVQYVELKKVRNLEFDAGVIMDKAYLKNDFNTVVDGVINPINSQCFNQDGKELGIVKDIVLNGTKVEKILVDDKEFEPKSLLSYSEHLLILNDSEDTVKLSRVKPKIPRTNSKVKTTTAVIHNTPTSATMTISAQPIAPPTATATPTASTNPTVSQIDVKVKEEIKKQEVTIPTKVSQENTNVSRSPSTAYPPTSTTYKFLEGKRLSRAIVDDVGTIIIKENTIISKAVIDSARSNGRLVQLALYAD